MQHYDIQDFTDDQLKELGQCPGVKVDLKRHIADIPFMAEGLFLSIRNDECVRIQDNKNIATNSVNRTIKSNNEPEKHSNITPKFSLEPDSNQNKEANTTNNICEAILNMFNGEIVGFSDALNELYEERSAIMEYDGGLTREEAEVAAKSIVVKQLPF